MTDNHALYAVFIEARRHGARIQWVAFPQATAEFHAPRHLVGRTAFMKRTFKASSSGGTRPVWKFYSSADRPTSEISIPNQLKLAESMGWELLEPVVAAMYPDDYAKVWHVDTSVPIAPWKPATPYKLLRAVERVTVTRGYRLTKDAV